MRFPRAIYGLVVCSAVVAGQPAPSDLKSLYDEHQWTSLRDRLAQVNGPPLYRGAVAAAFNDARSAEKILRGAIRRAPRSQEARNAYVILSHLFLDTGRYQRFHSAMEEKWAAFSDEPGPAEERAQYAAFLDLPDQKTHSRRRSLFRHSGDLWIPCSINGTPMTFFLDTGAGISAISESEAKRLGLVLNDAMSSIGTSTGKRAGLRTAVARRVVAGNIDLRDVSFVILPDDQEPWVHLPQGRRGLRGVPVLLAFRTLKWSQNGTLELGATSSKARARAPSLYFADDHMAVQVAIRGRELAATLDTGAETTDLYALLSKSVPSLLNESSQKTVTEVTGVVGTEQFESITLPDLTIGVGGLDTLLRPAHVILKQVGLQCCVGNIGLDLLKQAESFRIDFGAMTLELHGKP